MRWAVRALVSLTAGLGGTVWGLSARDRTDNRLARGPCEDRVESQRIVGGHRFPHALRGDQPCRRADTHFDHAGVCPSTSGYTWQSRLGVLPATNGGIHVSPPREPLCKPGLPRGETRTSRVLSFAPPRGGRRHKPASAHTIPLDVLLGIHGCSRTDSCLLK